MYCPHCGVQNERSGGYCRQCGQSLVTVQLAVDRRVDEVIAKFNKAEDMLAGGLLTFCIFFLVALINLVINGPMIFAITAILGFAICLPFVLLGLTRVDRLRRLLGTKDFSSDRVLEPSAATPAELPAHQTNPLDDAVFTSWFSNRRHYPSFEDTKTTVVLASQSPNGNSWTGSSHPG